VGEKTPGKNDRKPLYSVIYHGRNNYCRVKKKKKTPQKGKLRTRKEWAEKKRNDIGGGQLKLWTSGDGRLAVEEL